MRNIHNILRKEKKEMHMSEYEKELDFVKESKDDIFPDFVFAPLYNDFNDNYYQKSFVEDDLVASVKKLRRRYSDFFDYIDAMEIYNEYMQKLEEKYGGKRVIKNALRVDAMPDPVPAEPKLKQTRKNKQFLRSEVMPSRQVEAVKLSKEEMLAIARQTFPNKMGDDVESISPSCDIPKDMRKRLKKMSEEIAGRNRRHNMYRSVGNNSGTDFIIEYLNQAKRGVFNSSGKYTGDDLSLSQIMKENERIANTPPEFLEDELASQTEIVNGRLVRRKDYQKLEIYKELYSEGIDVVGNFGKSMTKQAVKMIRSHIGDTAPASKKEMKKIKKRAKKEREMIEKRRDNNRLLEKTLLGNKFSVDNTDGNISFRLRDLYRD